MFNPKKACFQRSSHQETLKPSSHWEMGHKMRSVRPGISVIEYLRSEAYLVIRQDIFEQLRNGRSLRGNSLCVRA